MAFVDIFILVVLLWAVYQGWTTGFLKQLSSLIGFVVGLFVAAMLYSALGEYLAPHLGTGLSLAKFLAFLLLWVVVPILLGQIATLITKAMRGFLGLPNHLLGAALSILKYLILLSCVFNVMSFLGIISEEKQKSSFLYNPVRSTVSVMFHGIQERKARQDSIEQAQPGKTVYIYRNSHHATKGKAKESAGKK